MSTLAMFPAELANIDSTDAQCTPRDLARVLPQFELDVCSNPRSHIRADRSLMLEAGDDGLTHTWRTPAGALATIWANWPYSYPDPWCERLRQHNAPWMGLGKLDCTTAWWRTLMASGAWWAPFRRRLRFDRDGNSGVANFTSVLVWKGFDLSAELASWLWKPRRED